MSLNKLRELVKDKEGWHAIVHGDCKESDMTGQLNSKTVTKQTLVAGLILHEANYSLTPYELHSAPGILFSLHTLIAFCISERRSQAR